VADTSIGLTFADSGFRDRQILTSAGTSQAS
jgi:hypothetical protein